MPDKNLIFDCHTFADESMTGYLTVFANFRTFLNLNERTDFGVITDLTSIEVHKITYFYSLTKFYIWCNIAHDIWLINLAPHRSRYLDTGFAYNSYDRLSYMIFHLISQFRINREC